MAVGLAWLADQSNEVIATAGSGKNVTKAKRRDPWRDIKDYLSAQPCETLSELLLEVAQRDDRLYRSLLLKVEKKAGRASVDDAFRRAIDAATQVDEFVDWRHVGAFSGNIDQVVDSLTELLKAETAALLVELVEYAIECVEAALEQVDDSGDHIGTIIHRLGELHFKACALARPDPETLAERLFHLETTQSFGICSFDAITYRTALGKKGLQRYRELAEEQWKKIAPRTDEKAYDSHRASITRIMERLAEASGDTEEQIAVKARDLSSGYRYLQIAEILLNAKRADEALQWAERGLKAFAARPDNRLRNFLVPLYLKRKRNVEALGLTWVQFAECPGVEAFEKLHDVSAKLGIWPAQRERALSTLAQTIEAEAATTSRWKPKASVPNYSLRVSIALWENDLDAAWTAAHQGICDQRLLITLANKLETSRTDDAVNLYRRVVPRIIDQTNNRSYAEAIALIRRVGALLKAQKEVARFGGYLAELRAQFKQKRNFIRLLDGVRA